MKLHIYHSTDKNNNMSIYLMESFLKTM